MWMNLMRSSRSTQQIKASSLLPFLLVLGVQVKVAAVGLVRHHSWQSRSNQRSGQGAGHGEPLAFSLHTVRCLAGAHYGSGAHALGIAIEVTDAPSAFGMVRATLLEGTPE